MSLKAFHIIFVIVSTLFSFGTGIFCLKSHSASPDTTLLALGVTLNVGGVALLIYGKYVLKKLKRISLL
ncbi:MAG: uncharacterized membrane protein HdeD (DUF308 family) [Candidatus Binatia bacterium]|jgi:uncharacterized membrane protein HdeD (DUF308 family)